jgi:hypothetical protein
MSHWTADTWGTVAGTFIAALALLGAVSRGYRRSRPIVFSRAKMPTVVDLSLFPDPPFLAGPGCLAGRAVVHVRNRSVVSQQVVVDKGFVLWPPRSGMGFVHGAITIPAGVGNWVGLCVWTASDSSPGPLWMVVRCKARVSSTGKAVRYLGRARLHQYPQDP